MNIFITPRNMVTVICGQIFVTKFLLSQKRQRENTCHSSLVLRASNQLTQKIRVARICFDKRALDYVLLIFYKSYQVIIFNKLELLNLFSFFYDSVQFTLFLDLTIFSVSGLNLIKDITTLQVAPKTIMNKPNP